MRQPEDMVTDSGDDRSCFLITSCFMPGAVCALAPVSLAPVSLMLPGGFHFLHFENEKTEAQGALLTIHFDPSISDGTWEARQ